MVFRVVVDGLTRSEGIPRLRLTMRTNCRMSAALALSLSVGAVRAELANGIKAVVHDSVITIADVELMTAQTADVLARQYRPETEAFEKKMEESRAENLQRAVGQQLILRDFKTAGYSLPESVIDEEVQDRIRAKYGDRVHLTKSLQAEGITYERFRQRTDEAFGLSKFIVPRWANAFLTTRAKFHSPGQAFASGPYFKVTASFCCS